MRSAPTLVLALVGALMAAPAATAATLTPESSCYQDNMDVVIAGEGYAPLSTITVSRDGVALGSLVADENGAFRRKFPTPELARGVREQLYELSATDGVSSAVTGYRATKIFADFEPSDGTPSTPVRFTVQGFGLKQRLAPVFLHYVDPSGRWRSTIRLGTARGTCGKITATKARRLFPFRNAQRGKWILQFDTRSRYTRATSNRRTPWVRKPVEIFRRR